MPPSADVIRADFDRIASAMTARGSEATRHPGASRGIASATPATERLEPAAQRLVAEVPLRARVLEIGCGTGLLARELATKRGARVTAIDLSPRMIDVARVRTPASLGIEYCVADFLALSPHGFDVVIATNTLHHLPLADAATRMADAVVDGGKVLIADLFTARGVTALPYNGVSWLARCSRHASAELTAAWDAHWEHDDIATFADIRQTLRRVLPNAAVRRHLGWRYTAIWTRERP